MGTGCIWLESEMIRFSGIKGNDPCLQSRSKRGEAEYYDPDEKFRFDPLAELNSTIQ